MKQIGRYQLQEKLGQGGMGVVYRAFDTLLQRVVAVKVISASIDENPELRDRFFREARAAGQLSHANIITVHDLGEHEGQPYLAMEYLEGDDLQSRMARPEPMSLRRKLEVASEICLGLEYAHARGIVHRDIKPANLFLTSSGVKILDFGLARLVSSELTRSHVMMGTLNYMAPEQIRGDRADHRADIFSVGVVLYELIGGRKAFDGDSFASMMFKILEQTPTPLLELDPTLPPEVINIVDRALSKLRDERYQTIADLERDLTMVRQQLAFLESPATGRVVPPALRSRPPTPGPTTPYDETRLSAPVTPGPWGGGGSPTGTPAAGGGSESPTVIAPLPALPRRRSAGLLVLVALVALAVTTAMWFVMTRRQSGPPPSTVAVAPALSASELIQQALASFDAGDFPAAERGAAAVLALEPNHAAAADLRDRAQAAHRTVTTGLERARALAAEGRYEEASKAAGEVLGVAPRDAEAQQIVQDSVARSRGRGATDARAQAARARGAARGANASTLAARPWTAAVAAEREAERLLERGEPEAATIKFYEATGLFASARTAADQETAARQARARAQTSTAAQAAPPAAAPPAAEAARAEVPATPPAAAPGEEPATRPEPPQPGPPPAPVTPAPETTPTPPAPKPAATAAPAGTASTATVEAPPPSPPSPPSTPSTPPPAPPPAAAVSAVLQAYRSALEARSLTALQRIWPGLRGAELDALRNEFEHSSRIEVDLLNPNITVDGDTATATFVRRYGLVTVDGQRLQTDNATTMTLTRSDGDWIITRLRFAAPR